MADEAPSVAPGGAGDAHEVDVADRGQPIDVTPVRPDKASPLYKPRSSPSPRPSRPRPPSLRSRQRSSRYPTPAATSGTLGADDRGVHRGGFAITGAPPRAS